MARIRRPSHCTPMLALCRDGAASEWLFASRSRRKGDWSAGGMGTWERKHWYLGRIDNTRLQVPVEELLPAYNVGSAFHTNTQLIRGILPPLRDLGITLLSANLRKIMNTTKAGLKCIVHMLKAPLCDVFPSGFSSLLVFLCRQPCHTIPVW